MKKILIFMLVLVLVGSFAFAEVTGTEAPSVSGEVTTTFGYSLDNEGSGFQNDLSVDITIPLAGGSDTHAGSGSAYAEITIEDIEISTSTDDEEWSWDGSVSAKILMGALYVGLGNPELDFNNVDRDADGHADGDVDDDSSIDVNANVAGEDGISIGYVTDAFSIEFGLASKKDAYLDNDAGFDTVIEDDKTSWIDSNETDEDSGDEVFTNQNNDYVFGLNASVTAGPLTVPLYFAYDAKYIENEDKDGKPVDNDALMGVGGAPSVAVGNLTLDIPFDYVSVGDMSGLELKPTVGYNIPGIGTISLDFFMGQYTDIEGVLMQPKIDGVNPVAAKVDDPTTNVDETADAIDGVVPVPAIYGIAPDSVMEVGFTFTEDFNDALSMILDVDLTGLSGKNSNSFDVMPSPTIPNGAEAESVDIGWNVNLDLKYDVGVVAPYIVVDYGSDENLELSAGLVFATAVDNATITLDYTNDRVLDIDETLGVDGTTITITDDGKAHSGVITAAITVSY